jgi:hypothetical protein
MRGVSSTSTNPVVAYNVSARRDLRWWMLLAVAIAFTWAGFTVDPASNCSSDGECAPILVPIAAGLGLLALLAALAWLGANPSRGSRLDLGSGDLEWWQGRTSKHAGDHGQTNAVHISRIMIQRHSESADGVHVYDMAGDRLAYLDEEVIPWPQTDWATQLVAAWPHITLDIRD